MRLTGKRRVRDVVCITEKLLAETFRVDICYVYLVDPVTQTIVRHLDHGPTLTFPWSTGLAGLSLSKRKLLSVKDAYNHHSFNGMVDIETSMPLIVKPIMEREEVNT